MQSDRVELSAELTAFVAERIAHIAQESAADQLWLAPYVRRFAILPLWSDWLETVGFQVDGSVYRFSADGEKSEYDGLRPVEDQAIFVHSLLKGASRYPELLATLPKRPDGSADCPACGRAGSLNQGVVCDCGGIGWIGSWGIYMLPLNFGRSVDVEITRRPYDPGTGGGDPASRCHRR